MENTKIEWATHTFNPVRGCQKISAGCQNCYAETLSKRNPATLGEWGPNGTRIVASDAQWKLPPKWNDEAERTRVRARVFCASLSDVFEDRPEWEAPRLRLMRLIRDTPSLDWLLLTKRPENIRPFLEASVRENSWLCTWAGGSPPKNVWLGTSVENQEAADKRIPELLKVPAVVRFLSCEPLLGPVDLSASLYCVRCKYNRRTCNCAYSQTGLTYKTSIDWVICGGESGPNARPMHPEWARSLKMQCEAAGVAFHFKQHGEWAAKQQLSAQFLEKTPWLGGIYKSYRFEDGTEVWRVGKKAAGRLLDGRTWDELPGMAA